MPASGNLPWKFFYGDSKDSPTEVPPNMTVQIMQKRSQRRESLTERAQAETMHKVNTTATGPTIPSVAEHTDDVHSILPRLEKDLKGQLTEMDQKIERLLSMVGKLNVGDQDRGPPVRKQKSKTTGNLERWDGSLIKDVTSSRGAYQMWGEAQLVREAEEIMDQSVRDLPDVAPHPPLRVTAEAREAAPPPGTPAWLSLEGRRPSEESAHETTDTDTKNDGRSKGNETMVPQDKGLKPPAPQDRRNSTTSSASSRIGSMIRAKIVCVHVRRSQMSQNIWQFLEAPESSKTALWFSRLMPTLVVVYILFTLFQAQEQPLLDGGLPIIAHLLFDVVCTTEVVVRFAVSPNRLTFFCGFFNWVDIIAGLTVILRVMSFFYSREDPFGSSLFEVLHCVVPVIWLLKLLRSFEKFHLLCSAFQIAFEALPVLLFTLTIIVLSFSAMIYFVEPRDNIEALPRAIWLTIVTMMTVGYGDLVPQSSAGNVVISALIIGSQLYMAIPLGIVGGSFSRVWEDRDRLLLIRRTRVRLMQWGYTPQDILELFYLYDGNKTGELDLQDFTRMILDMKLGLDAERIQNLFKSFDTDGSGKVDHEEFVSALYPNSGLYDVRKELSNAFSDPGEISVNGNPARRMLSQRSSVSEDS